MLGWLGYAATAGTGFIRRTRKLSGRCTSGAKGSNVSGRISWAASRNGRKQIVEIRARGKRTHARGENNGFNSTEYGKSFPGCDAGNPGEGHSGEDICRPAGTTRAGERHTRRQKDADEDRALARRAMVPRSGREQRPSVGARTGDQAADPAGDYRAAVHVLCGDFERAVPAERGAGRNPDPVSPQGAGDDRG